MECEAIGVQKEIASATILWKRDKCNEFRLYYNKSWIVLFEIIMHIVEFHDKSKNLLLKE